MAVNRSKACDPRWWAKWRASGAVSWDARRPRPFVTVGETRALLGLPPLEGVTLQFIDVATGEEVARLEGARMVPITSGANVEGSRLVVGALGRLSDVPVAASFTFTGRGPASINWKALGAAKAGAS